MSEKCCGVSSAPVHSARRSRCELPRTADDASAFSPQVAVSAGLLPRRVSALDRPDELTRVLPSTTLTYKEVRAHAPGSHAKTDRSLRRQAQPSRAIVAPRMLDTESAAARLSLPVHAPRCFALCSVSSRLQLGAAAASHSQISRAPSPPSPTPAPRPNPPLSRAPPQCVDRMPDIRPDHLRTLLLELLSSDKGSRLAQMVGRCALCAAPRPQRSPAAVPARQRAPSEPLRQASCAFLIIPPAAPRALPRASARSSAARPCPFCPRPRAAPSPPSPSGRGGPTAASGRRASRCALAPPTDLPPSPAEPQGLCHRAPLSRPGIMTRTTNLIMLRPPPPPSVSTCAS